MSDRYGLVPAYVGLLWVRMVYAAHVGQILPEMAK